ncbi:diacylglycerol kinase [Piscinibacter sp.]|uniref:diacylglycerol kinase n=1 Tax=Piscinibacter sp. TaxID=1903157 RepID=UPI0039E31A53
MSEATTNPHKGRTGLVRLSWALRHSLAGVEAALRGESAFRQEALLAALLLPAAFFIARGWVELALLLGSVLLVLITELLNSAVEAAIDRISYEQHELSRRAKDMGSAAVLLSLLLCVLVWGMAVWGRWG